MLTEQQNPRSANLDQMTTLEIVQTMNAEDATIAGKIHDALPDIANAVDAIAEQLQNGGRLFYIGAGTSGRLGILDASECPPTFGTPPEMVQGIIAGGNTAVDTAVEGAEDDREAGVADLKRVNLSPQDAVVGVAASGRTPYTIAAIEYGNEIGAATIGIACNAPAPLLDAAQIGIGVPVGAEVLTGSTRLKAGTAQKMVLNMLSTATMVKLGKVYGNLMVDVKVTNDKLAERARRIVMKIAGVDHATAGHLLEQADQNAKVAIVMALLNVTSKEARDHLDGAQGHLRKIIT